MDIQLLVNATSGGATAGGTKDQGAGGDFASNLAGATQARQGRASGASSPSAEPITARLDEAGQPADSGINVTGRDALLSDMSGQEGAAPQGLFPDLGLETAGHQASLALLSQGDRAAALEALKGDADRPGNEGWDALRERLALIERVGRLATGEELQMLPMAAQAGAIRPEGSSLRDAGHEPRGSALLQAIATDSLERKGLRQSMVTQLDQTAERTGGLEAVSSRSTVPTDEPVRFSAVNDTLMAPRSDTARAAAGFEPVGQGMSPSAASAPNPAAQASIQAPVSSPAWPQQLGQQLVRLSQGGGEQRVELQLHPAELGPLSVSLKMGDQGAQAQFVSAHAQVRQALEQAIPQLREALAEQGISLGETSVGEQRTGDGDSTPRQPGDMLASAGVDGSDEGSSSTTDSKATRDLNLDGRVDLYA